MRQSAHSKPDWDPRTRSEFDHHTGLADWVRTYRIAIVVIGTVAVLLVLFFLVLVCLHLGTTKVR